MMIEYIQVGLSFSLLFTLIGFCFFAIRSLDKDSVGESKERKLQAQLDAQADEMQRLRFRLRRIEDKLGIKE